MQLRLNKINITIARVYKSIEWINQIQQTVYSPDIELEQIKCMHQTPPDMVNQ